MNIDISRNAVSLTFLDSPPRDNSLFVILPSIPSVVDGILRWSPKDSNSCIISFSWLWERPVMMMWYHSIAPISRFCYLAKGEYVQWTDIIKLALKKARFFWQQRFTMGEGFNRRKVLHCSLWRWREAYGKKLWMASKNCEWPHVDSQQRNRNLSLITVRIKFCSTHMSLHKDSKLPAWPYNFSPLRLLAGNSVILCLVSWPMETEQ